MQPLIQGSILLHNVIPFWGVLTNFSNVLNDNFVKFFFVGLMLLHVNKGSEMSYVKSNGAFLRCTEA
jgi:hypothetical protein